MRNKKPKMLYEYNTQHELEKHKVMASCTVSCTYNVNDPVSYCRWRCQSGDHDFYGWSSLKEARNDEIQKTSSHIAELQAHLSSLGFCTACRGSGFEHIYGKYSKDGNGIRCKLCNGTGKRKI